MGMLMLSLSMPLHLASYLQSHQRITQCCFVISRGRPVFSSVYGLFSVKCSVTKCQVAPCQGQAAAQCGRGEETVLDVGATSHMLNASCVYGCKQPLTFTDNRAALKHIFLYVQAFSLYYEIFL